MSDTGTVSKFLDLPVGPAAAEPCAACPWRLSNHGKRVPGAWYGKTNLRRLWAGIRRGVRMSCHPTDPRVSGGAKFDGVRECTGGLVMQQRELTGAFGTEMARPDLNNPDVGYPPCGKWEPREQKVFWVVYWGDQTKPKASP